MSKPDDLPPPYLAHHEALLRAAQEQIGRRRGQVDASSIVQAVYLDLCDRGRADEPVPLGELRLRVEHKVTDAFRRLGRAKHGGGRVVQASQLGPSDAAPLDPPAGSPSPSHDAATRETAALVHGALSQADDLTEQEDAVLRASFLEGLTYEAIAKRFGLQLGSIGKILNTAKRKLRSQMPGQEDEA